MCFTINCFSVYFYKIKDRVHMAVILVFLLVDESCRTVGHIGKS